MKYYTLNQAVKKAYKENKSFMRATNFGFSYGLYNLTRAFFGIPMKVYYFDNNKKQDDIRPVMAVKSNGEFIYLEKIVDTESKEYNW